jgi:hypothetical protein
MISNYNMVKITARMNLSKAIKRDGYKMISNQQGENYGAYESIASQSNAMDTKCSAGMYPLHAIKRDGYKMLPNQISPDALLRRKQVAEALTAAGFPVAAASLATMVCRGGGPPYRSFGRVALYRWGDALAWAQERLTPPRRSTAEADAAKAASATSSVRAPDKGAADEH